MTLVNAKTLRWLFDLVAIATCAIVCGIPILAADEEPEEADKDSSAGLPEKYAKNYLIDRSTIWPGQKIRRHLSERSHGRSGERQGAQELLG
jgi:hypothetical protein